MDAMTMLQVLDTLQRRGKCTVMQRRPGASLEETGVKFA